MAHLHVNAGADVAEASGGEAKEDARRYAD